MSLGFGNGGDFNPCQDGMGTQSPKEEVIQSQGSRLVSWAGSQVRTSVREHKGLDFSVWTVGKPLKTSGIVWVPFMFRSSLFIWVGTRSSLQNSGRRAVTRVERCWIRRVRK